VNAFSDDDTAAYNRGYTDGFKDGREKGYTKGHKDGLEVAKKAVIALAEQTYGKGDK
jgi:flagellar biosynthesis/type III secretory pathway protein FliH